MEFADHMSTRYDGLSLLCCQVHNTGQIAMLEHGQIMQKL